MDVFCDVRSLHRIVVIFAFAFCARYRVATPQKSSIIDHELLVCTAAMNVNDIDTAVSGLCTYCMLHVCTGPCPTPPIERVLEVRGLGHGD